MKRERAGLRETQRPGLVCVTYFDIMAKRKGIKHYGDLGFLTSELILNNLPFFLFLGFLATIYIANAHLAESNIRRIQLMQRDLKELRWYYMSLQADNMFNSKRSEVAERVRKAGLRPSEAPPKIIAVEK